MIYRISEDVREEKVANIDTECYNHENEKKDENNKFGMICVISMEMKSFHSNERLFVGYIFF